MVKVENLAKLKAKIAALPPETKAAITKTLHDNAERLMNLQRHLVPRDTGGLAASIRMATFPDNPLKVGVVAGGLPSTKERSSRGKALDRAVLVEFGVKAHRAGGKFRGAMIPAIPPRPFFFPPYRALKRPMKAAINRAITQAITKVAAR